MRMVHTAPVAALIAQMLLIAGLAIAVGLSGFGLSPAAWAVGVTCGLITNAGLARGLSYDRADRLGPADWVTLARATLAAVVAALVVESFGEPVPVALLVSLAAVALALDAVDGWVARRTWTTATLGARFDGEVDAFLILVLSVYVARSAGAWVLAIGLARYAFLAAEWPLPWMRAQLPPRFWRKTVAAAEGVLLTIAASNVLPRTATQAVLVVALALLAESFGRDVWWLWRNRERHAGSIGGGGRRPGQRFHGHRPSGRRSRIGRPPRPSRTPGTPARANCSRRGAHDPRRSGRVGRPRRSLPAERSHAERVLQDPARGPGPDRSGRLPAPYPSTHPGRELRTGAGARGRPEGHQLRDVHALRPAVRPARRHESARERDRDVAFPGRWRGDEVDRDRRGSRHRRTRRRAGSGDAAADPGCGRATAAGRCGRSPGSPPSGHSAWRSALSSSPTRRSRPPSPPVWSSTRSMRFGRTSTTRASSPRRSTTTRSAISPPTSC